MMKVAVAQYKPVFLNLKESIAKSVKIISQASDNGADLIAFPETWLPGYPVWLDSSPKSGFWNYKPAKELYSILVKNSLINSSEEFKILQKLSQDKSIIVVMGTNELSGKTLYNSIFTFLPNGDYKVHRKLVPTYTEKLVWGRGDGSGIFIVESEFGNIGSMICWEHWMPLLKATMYSKNEFLHIAQWPSVNDLHLLASKHYAFEGKCFVIAAGTILQKKDLLDGFDSLKTSKTEVRDLLESIQVEEDDYLMNGGSCIIAPDTSLIVEQVFKEELTIYAELNRELIFENIITHDADGHYSRPDIFNLEVNMSKKKNVEVID